VNKGVAGNSAGIDINFAIRDASADESATVHGNLAAVYRAAADKRAAAAHVNLAATCRRAATGNPAVTCRAAIDERTARQTNSVLPLEITLLLTVWPDEMVVVVIFFLAAGGGRSPGYLVTTRGVRLLREPIKQIAFLVPFIGSL
jgi:hypothetical protein